MPELVRLKLNELEGHAQAANNAHSGVRPRAIVRERRSSWRRQLLQRRHVCELDGLTRGDPGVGALSSSAGASSIASGYGCNQGISRGRGGRGRASDALVAGTAPRARYRDR